MSDFVALLTSLSTVAKAGLASSFQSLACRVLSSISPCTVLTFEDMRLFMLFRFLLYTKAMLTLAIPASRRKELMKSMELILVLK